MFLYGMNQDFYFILIFDFFANFQNSTIFITKNKREKNHEKKSLIKRTKILVHTIGIVIAYLYAKFYGSTMHTFWDMVVIVWKIGVFR